MTLRYGIDLGGTKIELLALGPGGAALHRRRVATPSDYGALLDAVARLVEGADMACQIAPSVRVPVGVAAPGSIGPTSGRMRNSNAEALAGQPFDRDLAERLDRPVRLANDADCFALAEAQAGAARGKTTVFGVILGTGVGGGLVHGGRLLSGPNRITGEWGHNPMPGEPPEAVPPCYCGRRGCIELWLSGPGLARDHARVMGMTGVKGSAVDIAARAARDPAAAASLARHRDRTGRALAGVVNLLDPDAIVLGGGLSNIPGLVEGLPDAIRAHVFSDSFATPVLRHALGDSAGAIGAAWLWPEG
ncbi:MAG: ROK family protein [Pseudomonadota bacterium]